MKVHVHTFTYKSHCVYKFEYSDSSPFLFIERLLAAQNPLAQADRPHQLFADAPPTPVAAVTLAAAPNIMPPAVMSVPVPTSMPNAPNMPHSGPPMPPPGMPPPGKVFLLTTIYYVIHF